MRAAERKAAMDAGLKRYFTGKPCKKGHIAERNVSGGGCVECGRAYTVQWRADSVDHLKAYTARVYAENREEQKAASAAWRAANPERMREYEAAYYAANRDKVRAKCAAYYDTNAEARRAYGAWFRAEFPDLAKASTIRWRQENPEKVRAYKSTRAARKKGAEGRFTCEDISRLLKGQRNKCANPTCRKPLKAGYEVDHIIALANGGSNWPKNLQLLCRSCNASKGAKHPIAWVQERGLLL